MSTSLKTAGKSISLSIWAPFVPKVTILTPAGQSSLHAADVSGSRYPASHMSSEDMQSTVHPKQATTDPSKLFPRWTSLYNHRCILKKLYIKADSSALGSVWDRVGMPLTETYRRTGDWKITCTWEGGGWGGVTSVRRASIHITQIFRHMENSSYNNSVFQGLSASRGDFHGRPWPRHRSGSKGCPPMPHILSRTSPSPPAQGGWCLKMWILWHFFPGLYK